ncbi:MAG: uracil-DNA glycosylase [Pyrinomonadaceae bacterium]
MDDAKTKSEFAKLLADTKEHILFLQELGVEHIDAELPDLNCAKKPEKDRTADRPDRPEKYVPAEGISTITDRRPQTIIERKTNSPRRNIFDSARLSDRSQGTSPLIERSNETMAARKQDENKPEKPEFQAPLMIEPAVDLPESNETLEMIRDEIGKDCQRCRLCEKRTQVVNSVGNPNADLMFIGEAPGADEDEQGKPFVGRAGQLLTKMIESIDLTRDEVFIGNINRCRPPGNRQPQADEAIVCRPFLLREIAVVRPKVIVVMGNTACQNLLDTKTGITKLRGSFKDYFGVKVMPTFHPAYLLRDPRKKREVWEDLKTIRDYLNSAK